MKETNNTLQLDKQLCFALYVCSKEIIRLYKPLIGPLGLTYTSYIAMMALWEKDNVSVNELGERLYLDSGTLTPLLKKMEKQELLTRTRSKKDERTVIISLTDKGKALKRKCAQIPTKIVCAANLNTEDGQDMLNKLQALIKQVEVLDYPGEDLD
ncbi:MAG: MarR family transcriptional regulator [Treponema sp.]|nr:MarR family transcriptional regulator [Treponema sp.]